MPQSPLKPRQTFGDRLQALLAWFVKTTPNVMYRRIYAAFGFVMLGAFSLAGFITHVAANTLPGEVLSLILFGAAGLSTVLWGAFYGAWIVRLTAAWSALSLIATVVLLVAGFTYIGGPIFAMAGMFGGAFVVFCWWAVSAGNIHKVWLYRDRA